MKSKVQFIHLGKMTNNETNNYLNEIRYQNDDHTFPTMNAIDLRQILKIRREKLVDNFKMNESSSVKYKKGIPQMLSANVMEDYVSFDS